MSVHRDIITLLTGALTTAGAGRVYGYMPFLDSTNQVRDAFITADNLIQGAYVVRSDVDAVEAVSVGGPKVVYRGRKYEYTIDLLRALNHSDPNADNSELLLNEIYEDVFAAITADSMMDSFYALGLIVTSVSTTLIGIRSFHDILVNAISMSIEITRINP